MSSVGRMDLSVSDSIGWRRAFAGRSCRPASKYHIARDLRDLAIQRLFAGGLAPQSVLAQVSDRPQAAEAVQGSWTTSTASSGSSDRRSTPWGSVTAPGTPACGRGWSPRPARPRVRDNGRGVDPARTRRSGLAALRVRATELGGTLIVDRHRPTGTTLDRTVPLPADKG